MSRAQFNWSHRKSRARSKRFTIEESFRDLKNLRFGMGLTDTRISTPERRDRILLVGAIAAALLTLLGAASVKSSASSE